MWYPLSTHYTSNQSWAGHTARVLKGREGWSQARRAPKLQFLNNGMCFRWSCLVKSISVDEKRMLGATSKIWKSPNSEEFLPLMSPLRKPLGAWATERERRGESIWDEAASRSSSRPPLPSCPSATLCPPCHQLLANCQSLPTPTCYNHLVIHYSIHNQF